VTSTEQLILAIVGASGIGAAVPLIVQYFLKRREKKEDRKDEVTEAQVEDAGKLREELWRELKSKDERNDALSTRYGAVLTEKAALAGQLESATQQIATLVQRLTAEGLRQDEAEKRAKRDRDERERAEARLEALTERYKELERDYARLARGNVSRKSDTDPALADAAPARRSKE